MTFELVAHLGVHELDHPWPQPVRHEAGKRTVDTHLELVPLLVVDELDMLLGVAHQRSPGFRRGRTSSANNCNVDRLTRSCRKNTKNVTPLSIKACSCRTTVSGVPMCSLACRPHASAPNRRSASFVTSGTSASVGASASTDSVDSRIDDGSRPTRAHA